MFFLLNVILDISGLYRRLWIYIGDYGAHTRGGKSPVFFHFFSGPIILGVGGVRTMFKKQFNVQWQDMLVLLFCECFQFVLGSKSQMKFSGKSFILSLKIWSNISFCVTVNVFFQSPIVPLCMNWGLSSRSPGMNS